MAKRFPRASGILLHITSLPGPYGIGDLGPAAYEFIRRLVSAGQTYWQILPIGPTGFGDSPYQCLSSFAGNPNLISLDALIEQGWLSAKDLEDRPTFRDRRVDYDVVIPWHDHMLSLAHQRFLAQKDRVQQRAFQVWAAEQAWWLDDFALFISLKEHHGGKAWIDWPTGDAFRDPVALKNARRVWRSHIEAQCFRQWLFFSQWAVLKEYANEHGVRIIGDIPIFVGYDSCDVWSNRDLFDIDQNGKPRSVAGVPPDSFSASGQRWGNPLYLWDRHRATGYHWWIKRIDAALALVDVIRIDHFRGFDRYWSIAADEPTAERGQWLPGPGRDFFDKLGQDRIERIIAEDLGDDLGNALVLRDEYHLPGMMVLQFAFSGTDTERARFRPGQPIENCIVYTGTHDNNTVLGWWEHEVTPAQKLSFLRYTEKYDILETNWAMIRLGMDYAGHTFIAPLQDVLGLGANARMNVPGVPTGNWGWRCTLQELELADWDRLRWMTQESRRLHPAKPDAARPSVGISAASHARGART